MKREFLIEKCREEKGETVCTLRNNIRIYFSPVFLCCAPKQSKHLQTALRRWWGVRAWFKIKPHAGEWFSMSVCNDNRKCGLLLSLYRSWLKMFQRTNINKNSPAVHTELNPRLLRRKLGRNSLALHILVCLPSCTSNHIPKQLRGQASATSLG